MDSGYVVLARRYRPSQFDQVIGQGHVSRTLQNAIEGQRVHHAYLFTGSRGVGKTTVARIMAKALNCDTAATANPCDTCDSCVEVREGRSVDVYEIDGASHTGVDDVRELRESVRYLPSRCRHKIYIIDEVHMLSTSAFNALLKTLEEPPAHVVFMFATTEPHKIPATILSRCQRFDFKRVPGPELADHLAWIAEQEGIEVERPGLNLLARAAEGRVRDSLSLLDQVIAYAAGEKQITTAKVAEVLGVADRRVLFELSQTLLDRDAQGALGLVDRLFSSGQDLSQFAQAFLVHLRDLTVVCTCKDPAPLVDATESELADMVSQAKHEQAPLLPQFFDRFCVTTEQIARSSFPRLLLEMAIIEMVNSEQMLPLGDLLERLEELEGRLGGSPGPGGGGGGGRPAGPPRFTPEKKRSTGRGGDVPPWERRQSGSGRQRAEAPAQKPRAEAPEPAPRRAEPPAPKPRTEPPAPAPAPRRAAARDESPAPASAEAPAPAPRQQRQPAKPRTRPQQRAKELLSPPTNGDAMETWKLLLQRVEVTHSEAAAIFFSAKLLCWQGGTIKVGYAANSFELGLARGKLPNFTDGCNQHVDSPVTVDVAELSGDSDSTSVMDSDMNDQVEQKRTRKMEAAGHPLVRAAVRELGGVIKTITTEND